MTQATTTLTRAASQEQNSGVIQISGAMGHLSQATQQNASASEELAATAEEMGSQAEQLQELMSFFQIDDDGTPPASLQPPSRGRGGAYRTADRRGIDAGMTAAGRLQQV